MIVAIVAAIIGVAAVPLVEKASRRAKTSALLQNLHTLRSQIALYQMEHGDRPPVLYQGTFPQLMRATNAAGVPGPPGKDHPYGPYLRAGIPVNPITGRSVIVGTDTFPPASPTGSGGWAYHQETGQIAIDLDGFLTE